MANRLLYLGLGAALMYFYDPQTGRRRRADLKNQLDSAAKRLEHARDVVVRDARTRAQGLAAEFVMNFVFVSNYRFNVLLVSPGKVLVFETVGRLVPRLAEEVLHQPFRLKCAPMTRIHFVSQQT